MKFPRLTLIVVATLILSGNVLADNSMNGTYVADKASLSLYAVMPMKMYLVVNGGDAYFLMQGPDSEKKIPAKARVDGDKLILGNKGDTKPMIFYRRIGSPGVLDCHMCQAGGMPGVWIKVAH